MDRDEMKSRLGAQEGPWDLESGYGTAGEARFKVDAYDFGIKRNVYLKRYMQQK